MVQDWCAKHNKIPDTQFGFYPGRSTLHPLFILRHLKDAAQKMQRGSSRLYMWDHLCKNQMPTHMLSILENLCNADEYTLLDEDKSATVRPSFGVKQGCPLSPLLISNYLNNIDSVTDGTQGALTGTRFYC